MPHITVAGRTLRTRDVLPQGPLMKLAKTSQSSDMQVQMAGYYDFARAVVAPEDRDLLDEALDDLDDIEELDQALGTAIVELTSRPTGRPSSSRDGPQNTRDTSRVVSLSRGTVVTTSDDGQQATG